MLKENPVIFIMNITDRVELVHEILFLNTYLQEVGKSFLELLIRFLKIVVRVEAKLLTRVL